MDHEFLDNYSDMVHIIDTIFIPVVSLAYSFILLLENLYVTAKMLGPYNACSWGGVSSPVNKVTVEH